MGYTFLIFLLMCLLISCQTSPRKQKRYDSFTKFPVVRFSLDGHHFQIGLLTMPGIQQDNIFPITVPEKPTEAPTEELTDELTESTTAYAEDEARTFTQYAMLNVVPKLITPVEVKPKFPESFIKSMKTLNKMKDLYKKLGNSLKDHEKELLTLLESQDNWKKPPVVDTPSEDTSIRVRINDDHRGDNMLENAVNNRKFSVDRRKDEDPNRLNIRVHAEPPLKMRTIIGYPRKSRHNMYSLKEHSSNIRIYPQETSYSATALDLPYELSTQGSLEQDLPIDEETFLRRGSELLLSMWKRFQLQKAQIKPEEQESQIFNEDVDDTKQARPYSYYLN